MAPGVQLLVLPPPGGIVVSLVRCGCALGAERVKKKRCIESANADQSERPGSPGLQAAACAGAAGKPRTTKTRETAKRVFTCDRMDIGNLPRIAGRGAPGGH